jgi:hypothetical protein
MDWEIPATEEHTAKKNACTLALTNQNRSPRRSYCWRWRTPSSDYQQWPATMHFSASSRQPMYVKRNIETRSRNHCCRGKAVLHILSVSVALVKQHAKRMHRIILSPAACLSLPYFSTLSHKQHDFEGEKLLNTKCVSLFSTTFVCNVSHSRNNSAIYHKSTCHLKYPSFLSYFNETWTLTIFEKYSNIKVH